MTSKHTKTHMKNYVCSWKLKKKHSIKTERKHAQRYPEAAVLNA